MKIATEPAAPRDHVTLERSDNIDLNRRRLKILIYTTLFPNSVQPLWGHFVFERMRHLLPFAEIDVVAPVPYFPRVKVNKRWYEFATVPNRETFGGFVTDHPRYLVLPKLGMAAHGASMFIGTVNQVRKRFRATDYDLIDAHYVYPDGLAAVMLGKLLNKPVIVSARGSDINTFPGFLPIRPMSRQVLKKADALIAVSQSLKDVMVQLGSPEDKIAVIGNGVDAVKFAPLPQLEMRARLDLPDDRRIILSVGHLTERKGFHVLIDAMARLRTRQPESMLVIVGDGEYRGKLEHQIRALSLEGTVRMVGARPHGQLAEWYSAADVFALASSREGWPNVLLEAMACGAPVVATRVWGAPEIVVSDELGILTTRDADILADALDQALKRQWNRSTLIAHARTQGWDSVTSRTLDLYYKVLHARRSLSIQ
jgi:teichuronic acid biosynthesis glycosyltransferase TuaC